jgi:ABC-type nitrate/sulfonate/bicarbonate transport system substrate-binding protein
MKAVILAVSLFTLFSLHCVASAQLTKVTVGNNAISGNGLRVWMAMEAGIFRKNGLEVQLVYFRGGTITAMALVARETNQSGVWSAHRKRRPQGSRCGDDCRGKRRLGVLAHESARD